MPEPTNTGDLCVRCAKPKEEHHNQWWRKGIDYCSTDKENDDKYLSVNEYFARENALELLKAAEEVYNLIFYKHEDGHVMVDPDNVDFGTIRDTLEIAIRKSKPH